ncbi:MAG TPA: sigma-70 family RNA polymerase sigma factor [Thermoanaerobaculia bacterium]
MTDAGERRARAAGALHYRHRALPDRNRLPPALLPRRLLRGTDVTDPWRETPEPVSADDLIDRLVTRIQSGIDAEDHFGQLYKHFHPRVVQFLFKLGLPRTVCEELTQETFIRVFHEIGTFERRSSFTTWLFSIARNLYLNELRRRRAVKRDGRELPLEEEMGPGFEESGQVAPALVDGTPSAEEEIERREQSAALRNAVADLPPQMRRCVLLRVYQGLKYREIADVLGISLDAVKAHLGQAKTRLQQSLGDGERALARLTESGRESEGER